MKTLRSIDPRFLNIVSQLSHFAWGALTMLVAAMFIPQYFYYVWVGFAVCAGIKEFWYDFNYEDADTRGSDLLDFSVYIAGSFAAFSLLLLKGTISV